MSEFIVKVYWWHFNSSCIFQSSEISFAEIQKDLVNFSVLTVDIPYSKYVNDNRQETASWWASALFDSTKIYLDNSSVYSNTILANNDTLYYNNDNSYYNWYLSWYSDPDSFIRWSTSSFTSTETYNFGSINYENYSWLKEYRRIELVETEEWEDTILFSWYIHELIPNQNAIRIIGRCYKAYFKRKTTITLNYSSTAIETIANNILATINSWTSSLWDFLESWSLEIGSLGANTTDLQSEPWDSVYWVFEELFWWISYYWKVNNNWVLVADEILWLDKTSGTNYIELVYNQKAPESNNIIDISNNNFWSITNYVFWKDDYYTDISQDTASQLEYWLLQEGKRFRTTWLQANTDAYIDIYKNPQKTINLKLDYTDPNIQNIDIWDKVALRIEEVNDYLNTETETFVLKQKITIEDQQKIINDIEIAETVVKRVDTQNIISDALDRIKKLEF